MENIKKIIGALFAFFFGLFATAHAAVPTEIDGLLTDAGTVWTGVKGFIVGVVVFMVLIGVAKRLKKQ